MKINVIAAMAGPPVGSRRGCAVRWQARVATRGPARGRHRPFWNLRTYPPARDDPLSGYSMISTAVSPVRRMILNRCARRFLRAERARTSGSEIANPAAEQGRQLPLPSYMIVNLRGRP